MKKIFAFVLASLMVLSLVPASAFAAITKCPDTHTSTNCDCTLLYTSMPDCENVGFQAYVCDDCGEQFMDNLKPKTKHDWVSDPDKAAYDIEASCVYQKNGYENLICKNCDEEWLKEVDYNSVDVHELVLVSGVGCEKLYKCTLCDAKGYIGENAAGDAVLTDEVSHNWEYVEIETEPKWEGGKLHKGTAVYACKDCVATKKVDINIPACHESKLPANTVREGIYLPPEDYKVVVKPKNATCGVKGNRLVVKCEDCGELWYCNSTTCATDHKEYEDHIWECADNDNDFDYKDSGDKKHEFNGPKHKEYEGGPDNGDTNTCGRAYYCYLCNTWQVEGHDYEALMDVDGKPIIVEENCTTNGYQYRKCKDCGYIGKQTIDNISGHTKSGWIYVAATCASPSYRYKKCTAANCPILPTLITRVVTDANGDLKVEQEAVKITDGIEYIGKVNEGAHVLVTNSKVDIGNVNEELYCSGISYEYKICALGCAEYGSGKAVMSDPVLHDFYISSSAHNFSKNEGNFNAFSSLYTYTCKKCGKSFANKVVADTEIYKTTFNTEEEALEFFGYIKRNYTYVDGEVVELAPTLRKAYTAFGTVDAVFAAKFEKMYETKPTCQTAGSTTYAIKDYGTYVTVLSDKLPHLPGQTIPGKDATCNTPGTHTTYICKTCGVTYWQVQKADGTVVQYTTSPIKNPCFDTVVFVPGSCGDENGYYECTKCNTCYSDATCSTKYVPVRHKYVTLLSGSAATCNTAGTPEIRYCSVCNALEVNLIYLNGGKELRVNFNEDPTAIYKAKKISVPITNDWLSEAVTINIDENGSVSYYYSNADWPNWPAVTVKKMENADGHRGLYTNITVEGEEGEEVVKILASDLILASKVFFDDSEKPIPTEFEKLDHTKPSFTLVYCEACVFEYITSYTAAKGGHWNGEAIITDDCADGAKGSRVCVTCYNYYLNNFANGDKEAVKAYADKYTYGAHTLVDASAQTGFTCQTAGYTAELCTKCNLYIVDADSYEPANATKFHKQLKEAINNGDYTVKYKCQRGPVADYAQNGNSYYACYVCETQLTTPKATPCPGTGLEINMSTEYEEYMPNSYIELVISLDSLKGVNAWGLNFSVGYNPEVVKFVEADFTASPFATNVANDVEGSTYTENEKGQWIPSTAKVPYGVVSVASSSTAGVELKGNNEYAVLVFQVVESGQYPQFSIGYIQPWQTTGRDPLANNWYKVNAVGANGKPIKVNYNVTADFIGDYIVAKSVVNKTIEIETLTFLDLDESGELDIFDAFELYYLIETDTYSVLADADHDGDVDTDDLDLLYAVLVGEKTLKDILKGENAEEEERVIEYDDNGFVIYDSLYDLNEDGVLSAYEIAVMTGKIDADMNPNT